MEALKKNPTAMEAAIPHSSTKAILISTAPPVLQKAIIGGKKVVTIIAVIADRCSDTENMATVATLIKAPTKNADSAPAL